MTNPIVEKISVPDFVPYETEFDRKAAKTQILKTLQRVKAEQGNMKLSGGKYELFDEAGIELFLDACQGIESGQRWVKENFRDIGWLSEQIIEDSTQLNAGHFLTGFRMVEHWFTSQSDMVRFNFPVLTDKDDVRKALDWATKQGIKPAEDTALFVLLTRDQEASWQYYAESTDRLVNALNQGKADPYKILSTASPTELVLKNIGRFPELDETTCEILQDLAAGKAETYREVAQKILAQHGLMVEIAEQQLFSGGEAVRISAIEWLKQDGGASATETLWRGLAENTNEVVRAKILTALEQLGEDVSEFISPATFEELGEQVSQKKLPGALDWVDFSAFPSLRWADGSTVSSQVVRWWLALAAKLKQPRDDGTFRLFMKSLDAASAQKLSEYVLDIWIQQDLNLPARGILALTIYARPKVMTAVVREYIAEQSRRKQPIIDLIGALEGASTMESASVLFELSSQHRLASVREEAHRAAQRFSEKQGWTAQQLLDRTLNDAGLNPDGKILLPDEDELTVGVLNEKYQLIAVRDGESTKDISDSSKRTITQAQKILKSAVPAYRARLRDALLSEESWEAQEFREIFLGNGLAYRLGSDYLWESDGTYFAFDAIPELGTTVKLAQRTRMSEADAKLWAERVLGADGQLANTVSDTEPGQVTFENYRGFVLTNVVLQNKLLPLGWQRDWRRLEKGFNETWFFALENGLEAHIYFTGERIWGRKSKVPSKEAVKVALLQLSFTKDGRVVPLDEIPLAFRAFAEAAYQRAGSAGKYQKDWENYPWQLEMEKHSSVYAAETLERYLERST